MADLTEALIDQDAAWARRFEKTAQTLPQRARYRQAIQAGEALQGERDALAEERLLRTDKGARDLSFGRARLRQSQERINQAERGLEQRQTNFDVTQERLRNNDLFRQDLDTLKFETAEASELLKRTSALRVATQTRDALRGMQELYSAPLRRGSPEFAKRAMSIIADNPDIDKGLRAQLLGDADIDEADASVDEFIASLPEDVGSRAEILKRMTVGRSATGKKTFSVAPPKTTSPQTETALPASQKARHDALAARLKQLSTQLGGRDTSGKLTLDDKARADVTANMEAIQSEISSLFGGESTAPSPVTQSSNAAPKESNTLVIADVIKSGGRALRNPSTGETVFVDKDNNILGRLKSDGAK